MFRSKKTIEKQISFADVKFIDNKPVYINKQSLFFAITETNNSIEVSAKGIKNTGVRGCDNCNVAGKISYINNSDRKPGGTPSPFARGVVGVKVILTKLTEKKRYEATVNEDGSFGFSNVPEGVYTLLIKDIVIAKNCVVTK